MDKQFLVEQLTARLRESGHLARKAGDAAAEEARAGATPAEKREDSWVAQEYAGLARGQKERASRAAAEVSLLETFRPPPRSRSRAPIGLGGDRRGGGWHPQGRTFASWRRSAPASKLSGPGGDGFLSVVTPASPVGKAVLGRRVGDTIEVMVQGEPLEWAITFVG